MEQIEQIEQTEILRKVIENFLKKQKQEIQCKNICITVNNPVLEQKSKLLEYFKKYCEKYVLGDEIGINGTPHLQGAFVLKNKDRFSGIFKKLGFTCHLEKMKGNWKQQVEYCSKEKLIINFPNEIDDKELDCLSFEQLYDWQLNILDLIKQKANNRIIHWYWESKGNAGKTSFTRYLAIKHNACIIQKGKYADIMNHVYMTKNLELFIIDVPRSSGKNVSYNAMESIKGGLIFNSKYETGQKIINSPHIIVFANEAPDTSKLSSDRWNIVEINKKNNEIDTEIFDIDTIIL